MRFYLRLCTTPFSPAGEDVWDASVTTNHDLSCNNVIGGLTNFLKMWVALSICHVCLAVASNSTKGIYSSHRCIIIHSFNILEETMSASVAEPSYIPSLKIHSIWDALYEGDRMYKIYCDKRANPKPSDLAIVSRASLIGSWITVLLCGLALMQVKPTHAQPVAVIASHWPFWQAFNYFNDYPTDTPRLKLLVWVLSYVKFWYTSNHDDKIVISSAFSFINVLHTIFSKCPCYSFQTYTQ